MREIPLTKGLFAVVDDDDFELVSRYRWCAQGVSGPVYAARNDASRPKRTTMFMHRFLLGAPHGFDVDHINGDGLDNRRANIRICSHSENMRNQRLSTRNTSGYKGVTFDRDRGAWAAYIVVSGVLLHLGRFRSAEDAARAYDRSAHLHFGEFVLPNFHGGNNVRK